MKTAAPYGDGLDPPLAGNPLLAVTGQAMAEDDQALARSRAFAQPLLAGRQLDTGEPIVEHADGVAAILHGLGGSPAMQAASYLVYACDHLNKPAEVIAAGFGQGHAQLALETTKLVKLQRQARLAQGAAQRSDERGIDAAR
jgi:GTP pyrophosphokinase